MEQLFDRRALLELVGEELTEVWQSLCADIEAQYETDRLWGKGFGDWVYEYKYRRGGKTLCTMYAKKGSICLLVTLGKAEREKFESCRESFSGRIRETYDNTETLRDGKWMWIDLRDSSANDELLELLHIKRRPNRK